MSKIESQIEQIHTEFKTPHHRLLSTLSTAIFKPIIKIEHVHCTIVRHLDLVNGQPVSNLVSQTSDSVKAMSKYRVGDFSIITLDNIGLQSLRPQSYTPDIDAMLAKIK